jgi:hypothetical protein
MKELTVTVEADTAIRDNFGLYDYDSFHYNHQSFKVKASTILCMFNSKIKPVECLSQAEFGHSIPLIKLQRQASDQTFTVTTEQQQLAWLVVSQLPKEDGVKGCKLKVGDTFKIGRSLIRVKEIQRPSKARQLEADSLTEMKVTVEQSAGPLSNISSPQSDSNVSCRVCFSSSNGFCNPLLSLCSCAGTMKFIHLDCIRQWLKGKITTRQIGSTSSYYWKQLSCELCKELLPNSTLINGNLVDLVEVTKPISPFIVLEVKAKESTEVRSIHVVSLLNSDGVFIVMKRQGRGFESQVRIPDISVSRLNSTLRLVKNDFYLSDNDSKFGTLVLLTNPVQLRQKMEISSTV